MKPGIKGLLLAFPLCLSACALTEPTGAPAPEVSATPTAVVTAAPETVPAEAPEITVAPTVEPAADPAAESIFPRSFCFASGAGGWSTDLTVEADGSFSGVHHDFCFLSPSSYKFSLSLLKMAVRRQSVLQCRNEQYVNNTNYPM